MSTVCFVGVIAIWFSGHSVVLGVMKIFTKGRTGHATPDIPVPPAVAFHGQDRKDE